MTEALNALLEETLAVRERVVAEGRKGSRIVPDYELLGLDGAPVPLSSLFGDKRDLLAVHNMGAGCTYCTLWADGFVGLYPHLADRAAFVLVSGDPPEAARRFSESRGWPFPIVSGHDSAFSRDLGFLLPNDERWPGVSAFYREDDGSIRLVGSDVFGPGDPYCAAWPLFGLLRDGPNGWEPKYRYD
ncbi:MAG: DUF899 family protein [Fimbriimonadaceae bacterium]|nr:DUF899 family protein [Fimbriimonadaceae bacterium]